MVVKAPWTVALLALVLIWTVWFIQGPHGPVCIVAGTCFTWASCTDRWQAVFAITMAWTGMYNC
jgi:hypothetical protein